MKTTSFENDSSVPTASPFAPGAVIADKYRVDRELAEGGLGIVVVATHLELDRQVAIKYLKPNVLASPPLVERFRREAQLASSIRSDHVVRIYDVGVHPTGGPFMVMEYLEGEDLGDRVQRGPLPVPEAIDYIVQACDALAEAHALGIVHRDLKPENLFVARRRGAPPIIKILDFGISKVTERSSIAATGGRARSKTEDGTRLGTPIYMSPEQLRADRQVDVRTDIWSLGVVLFELVTGVPPFDGESIPHLGANILSAPPLPLRSKLPDASPALEAAILKCLEKNPDARYRNVAELVEELVQFEAPASQPRIGRIRHVIATSGASIRPPRPLAPSYADDILLVGGTTTDPLARLTPGTPLVVAAPMSASAVPSSRNGRGLAPLLLGLVAVMVAATLAIVLLRRAPPSPRDAAEATAAPPAAEALPPTTHVPTTHAPTTDAPAARPPEPAAAPSAAPAVPRKAAPAAPKKKDDYSDFGNRR